MTGKQLKLLRYLNKVKGLIWKTIVQYIYIYIYIYIYVEDITQWRDDMNFIFEWQNTYFTNERSEWLKYCFCPEKIKFISSTHRVMFFLLYRQKDFDRIIEGTCWNYVIDNLTCEIMENNTLGSRMKFLWILRVVYFPVKHSSLYNKYINIYIYKKPMLRFFRSKVLDTLK